MFPTDSYPLARRDILTLAGLASISPASAFGDGEAGLAAGPDVNRQLGAGRGTPARALRAARRSPGAQPADCRQEARRRGARRLPARNVGPGSERRRDRSRLSRPAEGRDRPPARRPLQPLARRRLQDRQAGIHRGPQLSPAGALCARAHRARLRRALDRSLGLRRAQPHHRAGHVQSHALAGAGAVGHDGLRQHPRARLPAASAPTSTGSAWRRSASRWAAPWRGGSRRSTSASR